MSALEQIAAGVSLWTRSVAATAGGLIDRFRASLRIDVVEDEDGAFTLRAAPLAKARGPALAPLRVRVADGAVIDPLPPDWAVAVRDSRVALALQPSRFLFRPIDLPRRAAEFIDGIVRSQIDRLTPWTAGEAVFHWTRPTEIAGERLTTTVVATSRAAAVALAEAFSGLGAAAVEVSTATPAPDAARVVVYSHRTGGARDHGRLHAALLAMLVGSGLLAVLSLAVSEFVGADLDQQRQQLQRQTTSRRAELRAIQQGEGSSALDLLARRKQTTPSSVIVLDALSALLPDHTYATELRIEGDKVQIAGITKDAPGLIRLMEQSPHFTRATFFAPTTRAPNDTGERFHIEARIKPYFAPGT